MKLPSHYSPPWSRTTKAIVASAALILVALAVWEFRSLIAPIVTAMILAYLLNPVVNFLQRRTRLSRGRSILIVYLVIILIFVGGSVAVGVIAVDQAVALYTNLPDLFDRALVTSQKLFDQALDTAIVIGPLQLDPGSMVSGVDVQLMISQISSLARPAFSVGGSLATQLTQATITWFGLALLVFALSIYLVRDAPKIGPAISNIAHQPGYRQDADRLINSFVLIWNAYLRGQVILALTISVAVSLVLTLLGVSNALALGALAGLLEFLPIIGPIISAVVAILVVLFQPENYRGLSPLWHALLVAGAMLAIQQIENSVLVPRIVGDALDLHPLVIMVAVLMGASLAGILGAVLAAPVVASIKLLGSYAWRKMLDLPPFADVENRSEPQEIADPDLSKSTQKES